HQCTHVQPDGATRSCTVASFNTSTVGQNAAIQRELISNELYCTTTSDVARTVRTVIAPTVPNIIRRLVFPMHRARQFTPIITTATTVTTTGIATGGAVSQQSLTRHINTTAFVHSYSGRFYRNSLFECLGRHRSGEHPAVFDMNAVEGLI